MVSLKKVTKTLIAGFSFSTYVAMAEGLDQLLVEPGQLQGEVERGSIVIDLREPSPENELSILPGATSSPFSGWRGPEQNPGTILSPTRASKLFGSLGLTPDDRIILATAGEITRPLARLLAPPGTLSHSDSIILQSCTVELPSIKSRAFPLRTAIAQVLRHP